MSAILSADDLNDFISPGVACIKPVESLPRQEEPSNPYEVTTEDKLQAANPAPASISLTDCLACSGCVTSAEAVLISLQSHTEVLTTLDAHPSANVAELLSGAPEKHSLNDPNARVFVASVSPQVRASLAATYNITERQAGYLIEQFLSGPQGLRSRGRNQSHFAYVVDTNCMREACLYLSAEEVTHSQNNVDSRPRPILTSSCPGWVCFAEKTHPHILPHLSKLKSPQALTGTLLKSVLSKSLGIHPSQVWHLAIMPCFDKKLEASREELTDRWWAYDSSSPPVRDVDCVITSRELLSLANERDISLASLSLTRLPSQYRTPFPHPSIARFLYPKSRRRSGLGTFDEENHYDSTPQTSAAGSSGGYLHHVLVTHQRLHPGSTIHTQRGRNADVIEYTLFSAGQEAILKCARFYGFRNIQNLVRKLKPVKAGARLPGATVATRRKDGKEASGYAYVEVMACPGGCTNGGGQIKVEDAVALRQQKDALSQGGDGEATEPSISSGPSDTHVIIPSQREWLSRVDSAYFSSSPISSSSESELEAEGEAEGEAEAEPNYNPGRNSEFNAESHDNKSDQNNNENNEDKNNTSPPTQIQSLLNTWSSHTTISLEKLIYTSFRNVESDVGKGHDGNNSSGNGDSNGNGGKSGTRKGKGRNRETDTERVARLAGSIGGGW